MMVSWPVIPAVCAGATAAILANTISFVMIGKVNERSPESSKISYLWWGTDVRIRFKQLYPGNKLVFLLDCCVVVMALCFVLLVKFWVFN